MAGLAAGWLLPMCDKGAHDFLFEGRSVLHFTGLAAVWLLPLREKGEQLTLAIRLATFAYINDFPNRDLFHRLGQCAILTGPCICQLFHHLCQSARVRLLVSLLSPSWSSSMIF